MKIMENSECPLFSCYSQEGAMQFGCKKKAKGNKGVICGILYGQMKTLNTKVQEAVLMTVCKCSTKISLFGHLNV